MAYAVAATNDGGCILTGYGDSSKAFTVKLRTNGTLQWNKSYGGTDVRLYSIIRSIDGNYVACGRDWRTNIDGLIIKIDTLGNLLWMKYYLAGFDKTLFSITELPARNLLVTGADEPTYGGGNIPNTVVMKLNASGDSIWTRDYNINNTTCLGQVVKYIGNRYVIAGRTGDTNAIWPDSQWPFILKLDTNGDFIWSKDYISENSEFYTGFATYNNSYLFATSITYSPQYIAAKVFMIDSIGNVIRQKIFNDIGHSGMNFILPENDGILFSGYYGNDVQTRDNFFVVRTDSIIGFPPIGIHQQSVEVPNQFILYQNFPNPFNPTTKIKFDIPNMVRVARLRNGQAYMQSVLVTVYDVLGREVAKLVNEQLQPGSYEVSWNASNFSSGIYFYRIKAGTFVDSKKMVLIK